MMRRLVSPSRPYKEDKTVREILVAEGNLSAEKIEKVLNPRGMLSAE